MRFVLPGCEADLFNRKEAKSSWLWGQSQDEILFRTQWECVLATVWKLESYSALMLVRFRITRWTIYLIVPSSWHLLFSVNIIAEHITIPVGSIWHLDPWSLHLLVERSDCSAVPEMLSWFRIEYDGHSSTLWCWKLHCRLHSLINGFKVL